MQSLSNRQVLIPQEGHELNATLRIPNDCIGMVLIPQIGLKQFAEQHARIAQGLYENKWGSLLVNLIPQEEETNYMARFRTDLLSNRFSQAAKWLSQEAKGLQLGTFAADTEASVALKALSDLKEIHSVVLWEGRLDLVREYLGKVKVPVLLIFSTANKDGEVSNQVSFDQMEIEKKMEVIQGSSDLLDHSSMSEVITLAVDWFVKHNGPPSISD